MSVGHGDGPDDDWGVESFIDWLDLPDDRDPLVADLLGRHVGDEPPMRTELGAVLRHGRAARARRQAAAMVGGCLAVFAVLMVGFAAGGQALPFLRQPGVAEPSPPPEPALDSAPTTPPPPPARKLVIPLTMEVQVRGTMAGGYDLRFVDDHPGDWNRTTPLPDAQADDATDWHLHFGIPGRTGGELWLEVFLNPPHGNPTAASLRASCSRPGRVDPATQLPGCRVTELGPSSVLVTRITREPDGRWVRTVSHYRPADHLAIAAEKVSARSYAEAARRWRYSEAELTGLARNPYLVFPQPLHRPPLPKHSR